MNESLHFDIQNTQHDLKVLHWCKIHMKILQGAVKNMKVQAKWSVL